MLSLKVNKADIEILVNQKLIKSHVPTAHDIFANRLLVWVIANEIKLSRLFCL